MDDTLIADRSYYAEKSKLRIDAIKKEIKKGEKYER